ncbi:hypothetical protein FB45DRAFT_1082255 [Roridomyces roridus]|uniref:F-box domain-containing protein n=1 Tax=Roridomyces roridus TaxID=1738132 RepID=A0AAD7BQ15_9AGAR|nr:hypothetical protein FB45DRAFT_1082255 [Roridomyces roridus]
MSLSSCPFDIIFELAKNMDLADSLHLAATCTTFARMLHSPSFWIVALKQIENFHRRPLPCPIGTDITTLPLKKLRDMAIHAYKLRKNWASKSPRPVSIGKFEMGFHDIDFHTANVWDPSIFCIPGTRMFVTVSPNHFTCWDATSGRKIGGCDYGDASVSCTGWIHSGPFHSPGMFYLGMASECADHLGQRKLTLTVCVVDYRDQTSVKTSQTFSRSFPFHNMIEVISTVLVNEDTVGAVTASSVDRASSLIFGRIKGGELRQIQFGVLKNSGDFVCFAIDDDLCVISWTSHHVVQFLHTAVSPRPSYPVTIVDIPTPAPGETLTIPPFLPTSNSLHAFSPAEWEDPVLSLGTPLRYKHPSTLLWMSPGSSLSSALVCSLTHRLGLLQYIHIGTNRDEHFPVEFWEAIGRREILPRLEVLVLRPTAAQAPALVDMIAARWDALEKESQSQAEVPNFEVQFSDLRPEHLDTIKEELKRLEKYKEGGREVSIEVSPYF